MSVDLFTGAEANKLLLTPLSMPNRDNRLSNMFKKKRDTTKDTTLSVAMETLHVTEMPLYEHTEIGWDAGGLDELALFMLVDNCLDSSDDEQIPIFDPRVTKIGLSFRTHAKFKNILHVIYLANQEAKTNQLS